MAVLRELRTAWAERVGRFSTVQPSGEQSQGAGKAAGRGRGEGGKRTVVVATVVYTHVVMLKMQVSPLFPSRVQGAVINREGRECLEEKVLGEALDFARKPHQSARGG